MSSRIRSCVNNYRRAVREFRAAASYIVYFLEKKHVKRYVKILESLESDLRDLLKAEKDSEKIIVINRSKQTHIVAVNIEQLVRSAKQRVQHRLKAISKHLPEGELEDTPEIQKLRNSVADANGRLESYDLDGALDFAEAARQCLTQANFDEKQLKKIDTSWTLFCHMCTLVKSLGELQGLDVPTPMTDDQVENEKLRDKLAEARKAIQDRDQTIAMLRGQVERLQRELWATKSEAADTREMAKVVKVSQHSGPDPVGLQRAMQRISDVMRAKSRDALGA